MKLTKLQKEVLRRAEEVRWDPPYGTWHLAGRQLQRRTCEPLERGGLIERGLPLGMSLYMCRLTEKGRAALGCVGRM